MNSELKRLREDWFDDSFIMGISEMAMGFFIFYFSTIWIPNLLVEVGTSILWLILFPLGLLTMSGKFSSNERQKVKD